VSVLVGCQRIPTASLTGSVTAGDRVYALEIETTALGGAQAHSHCGLAAGEAEMFIQGRAEQMLSAKASNLGVTYTSRNLPDPTLTGTCNGLDTFLVYTPSYTDHNVSRLPDGRLVEVQMFRKRSAAGVDFCVGDYPEIARALVVRVSGDCGNTWHVRNVIDSTDLWDLGDTFLDRENLFVDAEQHMMYLVFALGGTGNHKTEVLGVSTTFGLKPAWHTVAIFDSAAAVTALTADPHDGSPQAWLLQCDPVTKRPKMARLPDLPARQHPAAEAQWIDLSSAPDCQFIRGPLTAAQLVNNLGQPNIVPMEGAGNFRLVYPDTVMAGDTLYQIAHIVDIHVSGSSASFVRSEELDASVQRRHVLWPDLVWPEGFETDSQERYQQVLTWVEVSQGGFPLIGQVTHIRMRLPEGQIWFDFGNVENSAIDPGQLDRKPKGRFFGDYRYGTFIDDPGGVASYFAPWAETEQPAPRHNAEIFGAVVQR